MADSQRSAPTSNESRPPIDQEDISRCSGSRVRSFGRKSEIAQLRPIQTVPLVVAAWLAYLQPIPRDKAAQNHSGPDPQRAPKPTQRRTLADHPNQTLRAELGPGSHRAAAGWLGANRLRLSGSDSIPFWPSSCAAGSKPHWESGCPRSNFWTSYIFNRPLRIEAELAPHQQRRFCPRVRRRERFEGTKTNADSSDRTASAHLALFIFPIRGTQLAPNTFQMHCAAGSSAVRSDGNFVTRAEARTRH